MESYAVKLECIKCHAEYALDQPLYEGCLSCRTEDFSSSLSPYYDYTQLAQVISRRYFATRSRSKGVWRYTELLPVHCESDRITLGEGNTPLVSCDRWAKRLGLQEIWIKDESRNPTWSFKDRHSAVAVSMAVQQGANTVAIGTSGNHGASVAAYAAKAGLRAVIFTFPGCYDTMSTLMRMYGALVFVTDVEGRRQLMREGIKRYGWYPISNLNTVPTPNPYGHEGYKTIAYEICEDLNWSVPDAIFVPSGFSEGLYGVWKGFKEFRNLGLIDRTPRMIAVEPLPGGPLAEAIKRGQDIVRLEEYESHRTVARGIASRTNSYLGVLAVRESEGSVITVTNDEILLAQNTLAEEGIYGECTAVAAAAGLVKLSKTGDLSNAKVVVINSSCGLKDYALAAARMPPLPQVQPDSDTLERVARQVYHQELGPTDKFSNRPPTKVAGPSG